ncbi:hypothetical protein [Sphingopyxis sp.]|uniref:hypothetical protein n=1 Tax=Sphingopyxis sp. TaxID=1908224 RepID=UPI001DF94497|nr:hypothetical protein [Sphingopyxis sp.]MBW8296330.1 hypothetical protein [Sphingopyxis sp.]
MAELGVDRARRRSRHFLVRAQTAAAHRGDRKAALVKGTTSGYKTATLPHARIGACNMGPGSPPVEAGFCYSRRDFRYEDRA